MPALWRRILALTLIAGVALAVTEAVAGETFQGRVRESLIAADLSGTKVALLAVDLTTGAELFEVDADEPMLPASNMKLITSAAAIHTLGPDFVFTTDLNLIVTGPVDPAEASPLPIADPSSSGDNTTRSTALVIRGDGDPGFADPKLLSEHGLDFEALLSAWVTAVQREGVTRVDQLIVDDRVFDREFIHPSWPQDQLDRWYCAQVAGLSFNDNCIGVYTEPTEDGQAPRITLVPDMPFLQTITRATTGNADTFWISRRTTTNDLTFWGIVKHRRTTPVYVTVHDPPALFARVFADRLEAAGIRVMSMGRPGPETRVPPGKPLYRVRTPLALVLSRCNKDSQNLFAEALLKRMGQRITGAAGSWPSGAAAIRMFLQRSLGVNGAAISIADGSGLSRDNRVTARLLVELLRQIDQDPAKRELFRDSLAIGGVDGTLQNRFGGELTGRVLGKSGYIKGVSTLSGYLDVPVVPDASGNPASGTRTIAFSLLFNDIPPGVPGRKIKQFQEGLISLLYDNLAQPTPEPAGLGG